MFAQSSKPGGCFRHPTSHAYFHSWILSPLCFKNAESWPLEKNIPHPKKPIRDPITRSFENISSTLWYNNNRFLICPLNGHEIIITFIKMDLWSLDSEFWVANPNYPFNDFSHNSRLSVVLEDLNWQSLERYTCHLTTFSEYVSSIIIVILISFCS